jgi:hypothetical protein
MMMQEDMGASASRPGSREPNQQAVSAASGFDPSRKLWGCTVCWGSGYTITGEPCPFAAQHRRDSDRSGEAGETGTGSTVGESAGRSDSEGIAQREFP